MDLVGDSSWSAGHEVPCFNNCYQVRSTCKDGNSPLCVGLGVGLM